MAQAALEGVSAQYDPEGMADIPSLFEDVVGRVQELSASGGAHLSGVSFGLNELDKMTTGAQDGDLIIVAARPSMGKTAFGLGLGIAALETTSAPVQIYSLEMPKEQLMLRFIAILGRSRCKTCVAVPCPRATGRGWPVSRVKKSWMTGRSAC